VNDPDCIFCQIVTGQRPAHMVLESERAVAFLDARPVFPGHSLIVPRDHYETLTDLPTSLLGEFFADAQRLAAGVQAGMDAQGTFVAMNNRISQSVPQRRPARFLLAPPAVQQR
jgi:histidine triad (HIT) family protein